MLSACYVPLGLHSGTENEPYYSASCQFAFKCSKLQTKRMYLSFLVPRTAITSETTLAAVIRRQRLGFLGKEHNELNAQVSVSLKIPPVFHRRCFDMLRILKPLKLISQKYVWQSPEMSRLVKYVMRTKLFVLASHALKCNWFLTLSQQRIKKPKQSLKRATLSQQAMR